MASDTSDQTNQEKANIQCYNIVTKPSIFAGGVNQFVIFNHRPGNSPIFPGDLHALKLGARMGEQGFAVAAPWTSMSKTTARRLELRFPAESTKGTQTLEYEIAIGVAN